MNNPIWTPAVLLRESIHLDVMLFNLYIEMFLRLECSSPLTCAFTVREVGG